MTCACWRWSYREAGPVVWRTCLDCGHTERGRMIRHPQPRESAEKEN